MHERGSEDWHFTLKLWSRDKNTNLEQFEQAWEHRRPQKSKQQEEVVKQVKDASTRRSPLEAERQAKPLKVGAPFQVPPLPSSFVERPQHRKAVKALLLTEDTQPGTLVISAIYGLGGIGKSVLAAALAHDLEIQAQFPDGILWATLGQQPDILPFLSSWIQALDDYNYKPTTIDAASSHLRSLLYDKQVLLVVDDAWNPDDVEPFRVGGVSCRVLVTTREASIPDAQRYDMDVMTEKQSLQLLLAKAQCPQPTAEEQQQAEMLAKEVGYLPLALELAGAQIADGLIWSELLEDLQAEIARLETLDAANAAEVKSEKNRKRLSLLASFHLSLQQLSPEQLRQFAWLGVLPEDVSINQAMAATLWEVTPRQAGAILKGFWSKALVLAGAKQSPEQKLTYRLHDLMHDLAQSLLTTSASSLQHEGIPGLGLTLVDAHAALLQRYQTQAQDRLWHTLPDDGYIHAHLTWHLEKAQQPNQVHQLLQETTPEGRNGWYETCDHLGQTVTFVTDVARAWRIAEAMYRENPSLSIALQYRYALIMTSLNSLAQNIPAELMAALVEKRIWTTAQGLAYAQQAQEPGQRAAAIRCLAPHLPEILLPEAFEAARAIQDESDRAEALSGLIPHLPEVLLAEALEAARAIQDESDRAEALRGLAPHLPEVLLAEALEAARAIQDKYYQAIALDGLLPQLDLSCVSFSFWQEILQVLACRARKDFLISIVTLAPAIISLGGTKALNAAVVSMREVCQQWK